MCLEISSWIVCPESDNIVKLWNGAPREEKSGSTYPSPKGRKYHEKNESPIRSDNGSRTRGSTYAYVFLWKAEFRINFSEIVLQEMAIGGRTHVARRFGMVDDVT